MLVVDKSRIVYVILFAFLVINLSVVNYPYEAGWDESVYVGMGKFIYSQGKSGLWEVIRPFGLPFLLGAIWKAGFSPVGWEVLAIVFAVGNIFLTFRLGVKVFNKVSGVIAALLMTGSTVLFEHSHKLLTELPSTFFMLAALIFLLKEKIALAATFAALAAIFKFPHLLIGIAFLLYLAFTYRKPGIIASKILRAWPYAAIILAFLMVNYVAYSQNYFDVKASIKPILLGVVHQSNPEDNVTGFMNNLFYYPFSFLKQNIFFLLSIPGLYYTAKEKNPYGGILAIVMLIYLAYFTSIINKQERFGLLFMPLFAIFAGYGLNMLFLVIKGKKKSTVLANMFIFLIASVPCYSIITQDSKILKWRIGMQEKRHESHGIVLASDPFAAYYTNDKVLHYYFASVDSREWIDEAVNTVEQNAGKVKIIFNEDELSCDYYDTYCKTKREKVKSLIKQTKRIQ